MAKHTPPEEMPLPGIFCFAVAGTATQAHVQVVHDGQDYWKERSMDCNSRKWARGKGSSDVKKWLGFLSSILIRHSRSHRQSGIKEDGEKMMAWNVVAEGRGTEWISQISCAVFTHSQTLVSPSSNYFNIILCGSWKGRRRFLLRCPMMSFTPLQGTKTPLRPKPQPPTPALPFRTFPHAFLKSGTFSDLSKKCGASTSKPGSKLSC